MKCVDKVRTAASAIGASLDEDELGMDMIHVAAPDGMVWAANGDVYVAAPADPGGFDHRMDWSGACREVLRQMGIGLRRPSEEEAVAISEER